MIQRIVVTALALFFACGCATYEARTMPPRSAAEKAALASEVAALMYTPKAAMAAVQALSHDMIPNSSLLCAGVEERFVSDCDARVVKLRPELTAVFWEALDPSFVNGNMLLEQTASALVSLYTDGELAKMKDFYSSPEGRSIVQKQPERIAQASKEMAVAMQMALPRMMKRVNEVLDESFEISPPVAKPN